MAGEMNEGIKAKSLLAGCFCILDAQYYLQNGPSDVHVPVPGSHDCVILCGKRDLAHAVKYLHMGRLSQIII